MTREFELYEFVKKHAEKIGKIGVIINLPHFGFRGPAALFAANVMKTDVGLMLNERGEHIDVTARKRNSSVELNRMMEECAEAVGGSGGGHASAAGARIPKNALDKFMHLANKYIS